MVYKRKCRGDCHGRFYQKQLFALACQTISGPRSFPPVLREKALRFQVRIRAMPFVGGQPLPRRLLTCPALTAYGLGGPRSDECLKTYVDRWVP